MHDYSQFPVCNYQYTKISSAREHSTTPLTPYDCRRDDWQSDGRAAMAGLIPWPSKAAKILNWCVFPTH